MLVGLGRHDEALVVAERACTRAFIDLLLERQAGSAGLFNGTTMDLSPITIEQMTATVARQKALVLCFSVAAGSLYSWLLTPTGGEGSRSAALIGGRERGVGGGGSTQEAFGLDMYEIRERGGDRALGRR